MNRLRRIFTLVIFVGCAASVLSAPANGPQAEVLDRLGPVLATHDPVRVIMAYRAMGDYGRPAAGLVESTVNAMGYRRLQNDDIEGAARIFWLVTETFPSSANAWDSLAEATVARGEYDSAVRYFRKSLELDPCNQRAALMIERLAGEDQRQPSNGGEA